MANAKAFADDRGQIREVFELLERRTGGRDRHHGLEFLEEFGPDSRVGGYVIGHRFKEVGAGEVSLGIEREGRDKRELRRYRSCADKTEGFIAKAFPAFLR